MAYLTQVMTTSFRWTSSFISWINSLVETGCCLSMAYMSLEQQELHSKNIQIRKVAMWVFLMSEMMVFTSLFSTYMRYRTGTYSQAVETVYRESEILDSKFSRIYLEAGEAANMLLSQQAELIASSMVAYCTRSDQYVRPNNFIIHNSSGTSLG